MNRRRWVRRALLIAAIVGTPLIGYHLVWGPLWFSSPAITGTVIEEETGKPLPGAAVVAVWQLYLLDSGSDVLHTEEALSGPDGRFVIRAWGPKVRPFLENLPRRMPIICIYRPGYTVTRVTTLDLGSTHGYRSEVWRWPTIASPWIGKTMALARSKSFESDCVAIAAMHEQIRSPRITDVSAARRFPQTVRLIRDGIRRVPPAKRVSDCYETTYFD